MKNALEFDLRQFSNINKRHPLTKNVCEYYVLLESVGMNVYLYNIAVLLNMYNGTNFICFRIFFV